MTKKKDLGKTNKHYRDNRNSGCPGQVRSEN